MKKMKILLIAAMFVAVAVCGLYAGGALEPMHEGCSCCPHVVAGNASRPMGTCGACNGSGYSSFRCNMCKGTGANTSGMKCLFCNGTGWAKCGTCHGTGRNSFGN